MKSKLMKKLTWFDIYEILIDEQIKLVSHFEILNDEANGLPQVVPFKKF